MMITIQHLGIQAYDVVWNAMKDYTAQRKEETPDALWLVEHPPVYTLGQAGKPEHLLNAAGIPVIHSDRGGQITYHGPGQLVAYVLMDLRRRHLGIRTLVQQLEQLVIHVLAQYHIPGETRCGAPGVYVAGKKIASIGLRVKNGCTYHGIALNVRMDLTPFQNINPCGFANLQMVQLQDFNATIGINEVTEQVVARFLTLFEC